MFFYRGALRRVWLSSVMGIDICRVHPIAREALRPTKNETPRLKRIFLARLICVKERLINIVLE
jgi:hypothetical protein